MFSVQALLYGAHTELANRCLTSIKQNIGPLVDEVRIGLNEVVPRTEQLVDNLFCDSSIPVKVFKSPTNVWKYPLMRRMFYSEPDPTTSDYIVWFDDDSYFKSSDPSRWEKFQERLEHADMLGSIYTRPYLGFMKEGVSRQPWYTFKPCHADRTGRPAMKFVTGGWWVVRRSILEKWDWPWPELKHNGGDCTLGELMYQQGHQLEQFNDHVAINADQHGRESKAPPRAKHHPLLWQEDREIDLSHQEFELETWTYDSGQRKAIGK